MAIADEYVVRCLLQDTESASERLVWKVDSSGGYSALVNGVQVSLSSTGGRTDARFVLLLLRGGQCAVIEEPRNAGIFSRNYETDGQQRLSDLIRRLRASVERQCLVRMRREKEQSSEIRQSIYRQLLFSNSREQVRTSTSIFAGHGVAV